MRTEMTWKRGLAILACASFLASCSAVTGRETAGDYVDDATITTKVKADIAGDQGLNKANQIHVETFQNVVQLSGFVDSSKDKAKAEQIARDVKGVRSVKNDITVR